MEYKAWGTCVFDAGLDSRLFHSLLLVIWSIYSQVAKAQY